MPQYRYISDSLSAVHLDWTLFWNIGRKGVECCSVEYREPTVKGRENVCYIIGDECKLSRDLTLRKQINGSCVVFYEFKIYCFLLTCFRNWHFQFVFGLVLLYKVFLSGLIDLEEILFIPSGIWEKTTSKIERFDVEETQHFGCLNIFH